MFVVARNLSPLIGWLLRSVTTTSTRTTWTLDLKVAREGVGNFGSLRMEKRNDREQNQQGETAAQEHVGLNSSAE
jgi:hypothetical protein